MVKEELQTQAIRLNLTYESFEDFAGRVNSTLHSMPREIIENAITSIFKRLDLITKIRCRHKNWSFIGKAKVIFYLECYKISQYNDRILCDQFQELECMKYSSIESFHRYRSSALKK